MVLLKVEDNNEHIPVDGYVVTGTHAVDRVTLLMIGPVQVCPGERKKKVRLMLSYRNADAREKQGEIMLYANFPPEQQHNTSTGNTREQYEHIHHIPS